MKLEKILDLWDQDVEIDRTEISVEAIKISKLHSKYYRIFIHEKVLLRKYEAELKVLRLEKYEFYTQGPSKEQIDKGWELPACGKILKAEVNNYLEADKDIINLSLKIGVQKEKVAFLESIIESLKNRGFNLNVAVAFEKFRMGA